MCYLCPQSQTARHKAGDREIDKALKVWRRKGCSAECRGKYGRCQSKEPADFAWLKAPPALETWTPEDFAKHQARGTLPAVLAPSDSYGAYGRNTAVSFAGYSFDWRKLL